MANKAGFSAADVGGIIRHYTREKDESGQYQEYPRKEGGGHIDPSKTCENYQLGECHGQLPPLDASHLKRELATAQK